MAMLVSGPTGHRTMSPSDARYVSISQSTACPGWSVAPCEAGGRSSRSPWIRSGHAARDLGPRHRPVQAPEHRDLRPPDPVEHAEGVLRRVLDRGVAVDGRRADELEVGRERGDHEGDGVVRARVDVEDQLRRHGRSLHGRATRGAPGRGATRSGGCARRGSPWRRPPAWLARRGTLTRGHGRASRTGAARRTRATARHVAAAGALPKPVPTGAAAAVAARAPRRRWRSLAAMPADRRRRRAGAGRRVRRRGVAAPPSWSRRAVASRAAPPGAPSGRAVPRPSPCAGRAARRRAAPWPARRRGTRPPAPAARRASTGAGSAPAWRAVSGSKPGITSDGIVFLSSRWICAQERRLVDAHQRDRLARLAGPAGPADAVDVVLGDHRQLVVHDVRQLLDVDAAGRDVGRDQDPDPARP